MQQLDVGERVPIETTWWDANGAPANPGEIDLTITRPDGTTVVVDQSAMAQAAPGVWTYPLTVDQAGLWRTTAVGTLGADTVEQGSMFLAGAAATTGPCEPWCTWDEVVACGGAPAATPAAIEGWIDQASEILWDLSGRVYPGLCTMTRSLCYACGYCWGTWRCSCDPVNGIDLGGTMPVWGAFDLVIDGELQDPTTYAIRRHRWLVHLPDAVGWPTGWSPTADPDAFRVSWVYGRPVPAGGRAAAARLALEIAKRCSGDKSCQLPQRVTTVSREGLTFTVLDSMSLIAEGRTGLADVDLWVVADAKGRKASSRLFSPMAAQMTLRREPTP